MLVILGWIELFVPKLDKHKQNLTNIQNNINTILSDLIPGTTPGGDPEYKRLLKKETEENSTITAIEKYLEAADEEDNEFTTPMYLLKAGLCAEEIKDYEAATTYYTRILDDYPAYGSQKTIEKYIARTSTIKKK
jgi:tetratricopeptide (TPR) repeat protein